MTCSVMLLWLGLAGGANRSAPVVYSAPCATPACLMVTREYRPGYCAPKRRAR